METELAEYIDYEKHVDENEEKLNNEQLIAYQDIFNSVINKEGKLNFLYAPAGTGKTFLINLLLSKLMTKNIPYIAVASSGIVLYLKIPINLRETSICSIRKNSDMAKIIKKM